MPRVKIDVPAQLPFSTEISVRITDINYGQHLGNSELLGLLHEARVRFLADHGYSELDVEGAGIIMTDVAIAFKSEAVYGARLRIEVGVAEVHRRGCDLVYRVADATSGKEVALARTGIAFFDYEHKKLMPTPEGFRSKFPA